MGTLEHGKNELDILLKSGKMDIIHEFIPEITSLLEKFAKSGQSGGSAPYTAEVLSNVIKDLCLQNSISEITGSEEEWN